MGFIEHKFYGSLLCPGSFNSPGLNSNQIQILLIASQGSPCPDLTWCKSYHQDEFIPQCLSHGTRLCKLGVQRGERDTRPQLWPQGAHSPAEEARGTEMRAAKFMLGDGWLWRGWEERWCWSWALEDGAGLLQVVTKSDGFLGHALWLTHHTPSNLQGFDAACLLLEMSTAFSLAYVLPTRQGPHPVSAFPWSLPWPVGPVLSLSSVNCSLVCSRSLCSIWWWFCFSTKEENSEDRRSSSPWIHDLVRLGSS